MSMREREWRRDKINCQRGQKQNRNQGREKRGEERGKKGRKNKKKKRRFFSDV